MLAAVEKRPFNTVGANAPTEVTVARKAAAANFMVAHSLVVWRICVVGTSHEKTVTPHTQRRKDDAIHISNRSDVSVLVRSHKNEDSPTTDDEYCYYHFQPTKPSAIQRLWIVRDKQP